MALLNVREVYPDVYLGLWRIDETVAEFYEQYSWTLKYQEVLESYKSVERQREFLAVRTLLHEILSVMGLDEKRMAQTDDIEHNKWGKPLLKGFQISVSHTKGYAAVILSRKKRVAVDIEYFSDRVKKIASKFLRKDEVAIDLDSLLLHWCGKETLYKLFSEQNLGYQDMRVKPFDVMADWLFVIENLKSKEKVNVDYELTMEFVLTYSCL